MNTTHTTDGHDITLTYSVRYAGRTENGAIRLWGGYTLLGAVAYIAAAHDLADATQVEVRAECAQNGCEHGEQVTLSGDGARLMEAKAATVLHV